MAANSQGTHQREANLQLLAMEEKVQKWSSSPGGLGLGLASHVRSGVEQEEVGDKVHHWGIFPWREYVLLALSNGEPVSEVKSGKRRERSYTLMPSRFSKTVLGYGSAQFKNLATEGKD